MKAIFVTDNIYDQLRELSKENEENLDVLACLYIEQGMEIVNQKDKVIERLKEETNFHKAVLESRQLFDGRKH